jgi:pimeloyl-ACP methyl ester carboxylesterase
VADGNALAFLQESLRSGPACAYLRTHLVGISLGAHLAMACLSRAGSDAGLAGEAAARVDSACLLAPYLGPRDIVAEVSASGTGDPGAATHLPQDIDRRIWHWLQRRGASDPPLFLGYGSEDRFAPAHALMARRLPAGRVHVVPGGHHWPVWTRLWRHYLDSFHAHD